MTDEYTLRPIGYVRSSLTDRGDAPMQGYEGAPDAWVDIEPEFGPALHLLAAGDDVILIAWFHQADRSVQQVHPRDDQSRLLTGVFATRSPDRPNPIGLHRVQVLETDAPARLRVWPLEALDGTPVVDIKPVLPSSVDA